MRAPSHMLASPVPGIGRQVLCLFVKIISKYIPRVYCLLIYLYCLFVEFKSSQAFSFYSLLSLCNFLISGEQKNRLELNLRR